MRTEKNGKRHTSTANQTHLAEDQRRAEAEAPAERVPTIPLALARTAVCRRVPLPVRVRLDQAILLCPEDCPTLEAVAARFELESKYGITLKSLKTYADRIERLIRPSVTSHLIAVVLGLLPEDYRQQLLAGTQVLFLSRVVQALNADHENALSVAELVQLASVVGRFGGQRATKSTGPRPARPAGAGTGADVDENQGHANGTCGPVPSTVNTPTKLAEAVRTLYGLDWPPRSKP